MEYLPKIISSAQQSFSGKNPILTVVYRIYGCIYHRHNNNDLVLKYLRKCLDIQERTLPREHFHLSLTYSLFGSVYLEQENYTETYNSCQKALENIDSSSDNPFLAEIMEILGECHFKKNNYSDAMNCFKKALDIGIKSKLNEQHFLIRIYRRLGFICSVEEGYANSLDYYKKAIPIAEECNHPELFLLYNLSGLTYALMHDYEAAFQYLEKSLEITYKILLPNVPYIQMVEEHKSMLFPL
ncbi:unnamed protein product, partial [Adineta steineri]